MDEAQFQFNHTPPPVSFFSLFVSVYIFILVFFILLNSVSMIEKKKHSQSIASVNEKFSKEHHADSGGNAPKGITEITPEIFMKEHLLSKINGILQINFQDAEREIDKDNNLSILFPTDKFFEDDSSSAVKLASVNVLTSILNLVRSPANQYKLKLEILLNTNYKNLNTDEFADSSLSYDRVNQLHSIANKNSNNNELVKTNLTIGMEDKIKLRIKINQTKRVDSNGNTK